MSASLLFRSTISIMPLPIVQEVDTYDDNDDDDDDDDDVTISMNMN